MAGITKRTDGRYMGQIELPPDPVTGKRRRQYIYSNSERELKKLLKLKEAEVLKGNFAHSQRLSVEEYLNEWLKTYCKHLSPTTIEGYHMYITKHIVPYIGKIKMSKLIPANIQNFYNSEMEKNYSGKTIMQEHRILHKAFKDAVKNNLISRNPCDFVDPPKVNEFEPDIYSQDDFIKLLNAAKNTIHYLPIILAGGLGLRRAEVLGLQWKDIDFANKTLTVRQTAVRVTGKIIYKAPKNETSSRTISIPDNLIKAIKPFKSFDDMYVCLSVNNKPMNGSTYSKQFGEFLKKNNLKHIRFHDLRHFNATLMLQLGIDIKIASKRLGHSTPVITQKIYQHVTDVIDRTAADKINSIFTVK